MTIYDILYFATAEYTESCLKDCENHSVSFDKIQDFYNIIWQLELQNNNNCKKVLSYYAVYYLQYLLAKLYLSELDEKSTDEILNEFNSCKNTLCEIFKNYGMDSAEKCCNTFSEIAASIKKYKDKYKLFVLDIINGINAEMPDDDDIANCYLSIGNQYLCKNNLCDAENFYNKALAICDSDILYRAKAHYGIGKLTYLQHEKNSDQSLFNKALNSFMTAIQLFEEINEQSLVEDCKSYILKVLNKESDSPPPPTYSYHTFLYPFIIEKKIKSDSYADIINTGKDTDIPQWTKDYLAKTDENGHIIIKKEQSENEENATKKWNYSAFQYFNRSAQKALFSIDDKDKSESVVSCYKLKDGRGCSFSVKVQGEDEITLFVNNIKLKIYNDIGIGIIAFETEYRPERCLTKAEKRKNCKLINEFARRLYPPFLPDKKGDFTLCPEYTKLKLNNQKVLSDEFSKFSAVTNKTDSDEFYINNAYKVSNIISGLLSEKYNKKKYFELKPAVDERMFVCCVIRDSALVNELTSQDKHYLTDFETGKKLYSFINCDGNSSSCQDEKLTKQYLEQQIYSRWEGMGTIYAVTNHSMFLLTSEAAYINNNTVYPFLTEYIQMCTLVLVQRAGLLYFDEQVNKSCNEIENNSDSFTELMRSFSYFQGRIMLPEITSQIQGIELYNKVREMLFIKRLEDDINKQIQNLFEINETLSAKKQKKSEDKLSVIGLIIGILAVFSAYNDLTNFISNLSNINPPEIFKELITKICENPTKTSFWIVSIIFIPVIIILLLLTINPFKYLKNKIKSLRIYVCKTIKLLLNKK